MTMVMAVIAMRALGCSGLQSETTRSVTISNLKTTKLLKKIGKHVLVFRLKLPKLLLIVIQNKIYLSDLTNFLLKLNTKYRELKAEKLAKNILQADYEILTEYGAFHFNCLKLIIDPDL